MAGLVEKPHTELIFCIPESRPRDYLPDVGEDSVEIPPALLRKDLPIPDHDELTVVRHFTGLSQENFSVDGNFYPLGSCTMKYNPKLNEALVRDVRLTDLHPHLISEGQARFCQGALQILWELERILCDLTGMERFTFQPMAGANGELCGVKIIRAYHEARGQRRSYLLVPDSAHGTNPASATLGGYRIVNLPTTEKGYLELKTLKEHLSEDCAGLMLTSPNTLGLFNPEIDAIASAVHEVGGLLYYDGANFNALMGNVKVSDLGFDIVHLNLHKSFSTPHGSGGPGAGPVGVVKDLVEFLPVPLVERGPDGFYLNWDLPNSIGKIAPFLGNFLVVVKAYIYLRLLGLEGIRYASQVAVLNANYLRQRLKDLIDVPYSGWCMHEFVASAAQLKKEKGITALDIAKALIDRGVHPPTVYFPLIVKEALMIEPTETETKFTLDYLVEAIRDIIDTPAEALKSAPHRTRISRPDEVRAVKEMDLAYLE